MHEMGCARMLSYDVWIHLDAMIEDFKLTKPELGLVGRKIEIVEGDVN